MQFGQGFRLSKPAIRGAEVDSFSSRTVITRVGAPRGSGLRRGRLSSADRSGWHASNYGEVLNVSSYYCPSAYHGPHTDRYPSKQCRIASDGSTAQNGCRDYFPVRVVLHLSGSSGRSRKPIVGEHHTMTDEHIILDKNPFTYERVRGDLAPATNDSVSLNLDEGSDPYVGSNLASVHIHQFWEIDSYVGSEGHIVRYWHCCCLCELLRSWVRLDPSTTCSASSLSAL